MLNRSGVQNTYNHGVKIANWSEDRELSELRMKEYLHRKASGNLLVQSVQGKNSIALTTVPLSFSKDGMVHIGDSVMMYNVRTEGVLSVVISDRIASSDEGYSVTTSTSTQAHVARNVFVVEGYGNGFKTGDVLKLGQPFRLRAHEAMQPLTGDKVLYLHSKPLSALNSSKITRRQEVAVVNVSGYDTVWIAAFKNHDKRFEMEGQPVPANAEIIISHAGTKQALSSDFNTYASDFGNEYETCAHTVQKEGKMQSLYNEKVGNTTADIPAKQEQAPNWWAFLTGADAPSS